MALGPSDAQVHPKYEVHHHSAEAGSRDPSKPEPIPSAIYVSDETRIKVSENMTLTRCRSHVLAFQTT